MKIQSWIHASRPKTLFLTLSPVITGGFIALSENHFSPAIFWVCMLTTLFLQVLSNLANDYGDFKKGTDALNRIGPTRMVQAGEISPTTMKYAIIAVSGLALISGIVLLYLSIESLTDALIWLGIGIASIVAALSYTLGKHPYGYNGLGDIFVFIFFGLVGVVGSYYLQTKNMQGLIFLPAASIGLLSSAVLNINNIRDRENDIKANKYTLVVRMGLANAKIYHIILITLSLVCAGIYSIISYNSIFNFLFILSIPIVISNIRAIYTYTDPKELNNQLRNLSLGTFLFSLLFGIGLIL